MSTQVPAVVSCTNEEIVRPIADFHPSLWGNHFLTGASNFKSAIDATTQEQHEALKQEIRRMITARTEKPAQKLQLIDVIQRLGVSYHFEKEIEDVLEELSHDLDCDSDDLYTASLRFRLLRQQGIKISCDVFEKFKDRKGNFNTSLINDVQGMLSLYEAAYLAIRGEDVLDEAIDFTITHLKSMVSTVSPNLAEQINHALFRPRRKAIPRLEARYFMSIYPGDDLHNETLLKFAKLDFNELQELHQKELSDLTKWWKDLNFTAKVPYARDRLVELYFWGLGTYFVPQYAFGRNVMTKLNYMLTMIDDTYDAYGTLEELSLFTEAIRRWNIDAVDMLPEYMKLIYKTLLDVFNDIEEDLAKEGRSYCIPYAKYAEHKVIEAYFVQAKWFNEGYVPSMEEYMPVALISCAYTLVITISFLGMGDIATKESFEWMSNNPKIVRASTVICRLMDDIQSHEFEQKRGHVASAMECYMKQHGVSEEEVTKIFQEEVANAWKDINEEFLKPTAVPMALLEPILNLARAIDFMYKDDDCYTHAYLIKDQIASMLRDPVT